MIRMLLLTKDDRAWHDLPRYARERAVRRWWEEGKAHLVNEEVVKAA